MSSGDEYTDALLRCLTDDWRKASDVCDEAMRLTDSTKRTMQRRLKKLVERGDVLADDNDEHGTWQRSYGVRLA